MPVLTDVFERLAGRVRERELNSHDQLAAAAKRVAKGENVDIASIEDALHNVGQTVSDFAALVEFEEERRECFQKLESAPSARSRQDKLDQQITAESTKFAEVRDAYQTRLAKLQEERKEISKTVEAADAAKDWLLDARNTVGRLKSEYLEALEQKQQAESKVQTLERQAKEQRDTINSIDAEIEQIRADYDKQITERGYPGVRKKGQPHERPLPQDVLEQIESLTTRKARCERRLAETEVELTAARLMVAPSESRVAAVQKRLLTP
jgi:chromosome segregation ATPase